MKSNVSERFKGLVVVYLGVFFISVEPILIRFSGSSSWNTAFWFGILIAISMSVIAKFVSRKSVFKLAKESGYPLLFASLAMGCSATSFITAVQYTSAANSILIVSTASIFAAVFSRIFIGEKTHKRTIISILIIIICIAGMLYDSLTSGGLKGNLFALLATIVIASNQTLLRKYKDVSRIAVVAFGGLAVMFVSLPFAEPMSVQASNYLALLIMGLVTAPLARVFVNTAIRYLPVAEVGMITLLQVFLTAIAAWIAFNEIPNMATLIGGSIITITLGVHTLMGSK